MLDLLLPQRCLACGRSGAVVCRACLDALPRLEPPLCERCGAPTAWPVRRCAECSGRTRRVRVGPRRGRLRRARSPRSSRAGRSTACAGSRRPRPTSSSPRSRAPTVEALTFVPPDRDRVLKRGHHPAERLARELGERWELPVARRALAHRARRRAQRGSSLAERRRNVRGAFAADDGAARTSASSTTSTRPARRRPRRRRRSARPVRARCTS